MKKIIVQLSLKELKPEVHPRVLKQLLEEYNSKHETISFDVEDAFTVKMYVELPQMGDLKDKMVDFFDYIEDWLDNWYISDEFLTHVPCNGVLECA